MFKNLLFGILFLLVSTFCSYGQAKIAEFKCRSTTSRASLSFTELGDINFVPCPTRTMQLNGANIAVTGLATLNGLVGATQNFTVGTADIGAFSSSGTTHTLNLPITAVSGATRTNFFPVFEGENTLAKSPFKWDGTVFTWNTPSQNATFSMSFTPSSSNGSFFVGDFINYDAFLQLSQFTKNAVLQCSNCAVGDVSGVTNQTQFIIDDAGRSFNFLENTRVANVSFDLNNRRLELNSGTGVTTFGDVNAIGNSTIVTVNDLAQKIDFHAQHISLDVGNAGLAIDNSTESVKVSAGNFYLPNASTPPSASSPCTQGRINWDASYIYVCVGTDTWKRVALATF
jgi:hypothetical protein